MNPNSVRGELIRLYLKRLQARAAAREKERAQARHQLELDDEELEFLGLKRQDKPAPPAHPF